MAGAAAGIEQAGLARIGQIHQRPRRQRQQLAAIGLALEFRGDGQLASAQLQRLPHFQVERHQSAMIEIDLARGRRLAYMTAARRIAELQRAAERVSRAGCQHVEQLGLLTGKRHAGETGAVCDLQAALARRVGVAVGQRLR